MVPSLDVLQRLLGAAGVWLVPVDSTGRLVLPMRDSGLSRDLANRRFPTHLDTILAPDPGEWWKDLHGFSSSPDTFHRDRELRNWLRRRRAQHRVSYGLVDPPAPPGVAEHLRELAELRLAARGGYRPTPEPEPAGPPDADDWPEGGPGGSPDWVDWPDWPNVRADSPEQPEQPEQPERPGQPERLA